MQKPLIAALIASAFFSLNAQAADLLDVYKQALANDAVFASARASAAVGRERVPQGRSLLMPTIGASGSVVKNDTDVSPWNEGQPGVFGGGNNLRTTDYALSLTQPLFR